MSLPWDVYKPEDEPEFPPPTPAPVPAPEVPYEEPELPYTPPVNLPVRTGDVDFAKMLKDAFVEALREAGPKLKEGAKDYAQDSWEGIKKGETVDVLNPTVTAETSQGRKLIVADAKSRSGRTLVQGLVIDLVFAVIALLGTLTQSDVLDKATWTIFFVLLGKTLIQTSFAYFMRLKVTPTIKTPGERMAIMPIPRPMVDEEWKERSA